MSDDSGLMSDDGENDDDRGHNDDDHDYHDSLCYLHGDEGDYGNDDRSDDGCKCRDSVYHLCICLESDGFHGHNDDDHDSRVNDADDEGENDRDSGGLIDVGESDDSWSREEDLEEVEIYHGCYRCCALCLLSFRRYVEKWVLQDHAGGVLIEMNVEVEVVILV